MCKVCYFFVLLLLAACSSGREPMPVDTIISSKKSAPENYIMRVSQKCFCRSQLQGPFAIKVIDGKAVSLQHITLDKEFPLRLAGDEVPTLKSILSRIEKSRVQGVYKKNITWLQKPFVPKHVYIDYSKNISDDEIDITIEYFEVLVAQE